MIKKEIVLITNERLIGLDVDETSDGRKFYARTEDFRIELSFQDYCLLRKMKDGNRARIKLVFDFEEV